MARRGKIERKEKYENNIQIKEKKWQTNRKIGGCKWDNMNHTHLLFDCFCDCFWGNILRIYF
jgi:hypothetical protein